MIGFSVMLVTFIMAYAECGLALFGDCEYKFSSLGNAIITMMGLSVCKFRYEDLIEKDEWKTRVFYMSFVFVVYVLLMLHAFLGIVNTAYEEANLNSETKRPKLLEVIRLFFQKVYDLLYLILCRKRRLREEINTDAVDEWESKPTNTGKRKLQIK